MLNTMFSILFLTMSVIGMASGTMFGSHSPCCSNAPTLNSSFGEGSVIEIGGLKAYSSGSSRSKLAIILISDVFGYEAPNLRKLADKVAAAGFYAVVPDFFHGDPYVPEKSYEDWIKGHGPDKGFEDAKPLIVALRDKGVTAIGAAGICWGGKVAVELSKHPYIQAAVLLHPGLVTVDDIKEVKAPIAVLGAEHDEISPPALLKKFEDVLSTTSDVKGHVNISVGAVHVDIWYNIQQVKGYVKIFDGVAHGWTVRYDTNDAEAVKRAEEAHKDMLDWFIEYVKP